MTISKMAKAFAAVAVVASLSAAASADPHSSNPNIDRHHGGRQNGRQYRQNYNVQPNYGYRNYNQGVYQAPYRNNNGYYANPYANNGYYGAPGVYGRNGYYNPNGGLNAGGIVNGLLNSGILNQIIR